MPKKIDSLSRLYILSSIYKKTLFMYEYKKSDFSVLLASANIKKMKNTILNSFLYTQNLFVSARDTFENNGFIPQIFSNSYLIATDSEKLSTQNSSSKLLFCFFAKY